MGDANSAYTMADIDRLKKLDAFNLMMLEQPFHWEDMVDHAALQSRISTPVCLDETIHFRPGRAKSHTDRRMPNRESQAGAASEGTAKHAAYTTPAWSAAFPSGAEGCWNPESDGPHNVALSTLENFSLPGDVSASRRYWDEDIVDPEITVTTDGKIIPPTGPGIGYRVRQDLIENLTTRQRTFSA